MNTRPQNERLQHKRFLFRIVPVIFIATFLLAFAMGAAPAPHPTKYFTIRVIDQTSGRGVPMVELKTTNDARYFADSNGIVAFYEPGLMERKVWFSVKSPGYEFPQNAFGEHGVTLKTVPGKTVVLKLNRLNIAERLYRLTGEGIYRDSVMVGRPVPIEHPLLNSQVVGQDTVMATPYQGRIFWFFGDTVKPSFPLGNFGTSGATSELPDQGGLNPDVGVDLKYFTDASGFSKPMIPSSAVPGPGPKWIDGLVLVKGVHGRARLIAHYVRIKSLVKIYEQGLVIFNNQSASFDRLERFPVNAPLHPGGRPFLVLDRGLRYYYFTAPYHLPLVRVRADLKDIMNMGSYQGFTCLLKGTRYEKDAPRLDRAPNGRLIYRWKTNTPPLTNSQDKQLIKDGKMKPDESLYQLEDFDTGAPIEAQAGSVYWNAFCKRWIMIAQKNPGEVWYAQGDTPVGPWVYAKKIASHGNYTFYWPAQLPFFDQENGRIIYFTGTYTNAFSGNPLQTPRYNYNQIMYRLRLDDPRLDLPVPVYQIESVNGRVRYLTRNGVEAHRVWNQVDTVPFFAFPPNRHREGTIPIFSTAGDARLGLIAPPASAGKSRPLFYALPTEAPTPAQVLQGTWHCIAKGRSGNEQSFTMTLNLQGTDVTGSASPGEPVVTGGTFKDGKLRIDLQLGKDKYVFSATLSHETLSGEYRQVNGTSSGAWAAVHKGFFWQQEKSSAVVPLYEYEKEAGGSWVYSTNPNLQSPGLHRSPNPICRVWRNPLSDAFIDRNAGPDSQ